LLIEIDFVPPGEIEVVRNINGDKEELVISWIISVSPNIYLFFVVRYCTVTNKLVSMPYIG